MTDPHLGFIVAAYGVTVTIVAAMIASVLLDRALLRRRLDQIARRAAAEKAQER